MKKTCLLAFPAMFLLILPASALAQSSSPMLLFSDLTWGPKAGWEGSATKGAAITIWGKNFGASRGSSHVTVGGVNLVSDSDYADWGATGTANHVARGLERTTFWLSSSMASGNTTISVTVNGVTSNSLPFNITTGGIYFVSPSGSNSNNGLYASQGSGANGPFKDIWKGFNPCGSTDPVHGSGSCNPLQDGQYIVYVRAGTYTTLDAESSFVAIRGPYGGPTKQKALIAYPGETPTINTSNAYRGIIWVADYSPYGHFDYYTISKLYNVGGAAPYGTFGSHVRYVGNHIKDNMDSAWSGLIWVGGSQDVHIYGNYFDHNGYDSYKHNIYIKSQPAIPEIDQGSQYVYIGWNEISDPVAGTDNRGGAIFISKSSDSLYDTRNIYIHDNYFHGGNEEFIYTGDNTDLYDIYIYNNIFTGGSQGSGAIFLAWNTRSVYVYNNVFYNTHSGIPLVSVTGNTAAVMRNNVFNVLSGQEVFGIETYQGATINSGYDIFYGAGVPSGGGITVANARTGNPLFVNAGNADFHLQAGSAAIDAGTSAISSIVTADYDGISRPQGSGYDIGAYEYLSGSSYDTQPPTIQITSPTSNATYSTGTSPMNISGTASDNTSVSQVIWFNDREGSGTATGTVSWSASVALYSGDNIITVTARDPSGNTGTDSITVNYTAPDTTPPVRSGGSPSGTLSAGTTSATLSLTTDEPATCRYSTTSGVTYASMTNTFSGVDSTSHSATVSGLQNGSSYNYYVRCQDGAGNYNTNDFTISFSVAASGGACIHESDNSPCDGCVDNLELSAFIDRWKVNNLDVTIRKLMEAIGFWKSGAGCSQSTCPEGQITSSCTCGGVTYSSGYCCSDEYEILGSCCPNGPIPSSGCYCSAQYGIRYDNYCCGNVWSSVAC